MARHPPYRRSSGQPADPPAALRRYVLPVVVLLGTLLVVMAIAGNAIADVVLAWVHAVWLLPILLPGAMLGLALTAPLAKIPGGAPWAGSPWPDAYRLILSLAVGLGVLALATLVLGTVHGLTYGPAVLLIVAAAVGVVPAWRFIREADRGFLQGRVARTDLLLLVAAVPLATLALAVTLILPPGNYIWANEGYGYDVLEYHLQLPREYAGLNATAPLAHNVYSFFPANMEMLYLLLVSLVKSLTGSTEAGGFVYPAGMLHAILTVLAAAVVGLAPWKLHPVSRLLSALLMLAVPWMLIVGSLPYNDGLVLLYAALALTLALAPRSTGTMSVLGRACPAGWYAAGLLGVLLGLAVGVKLTAATMVAIPVGAVLLAQRRWRDAAIAGAVAAACFAPWALRAGLPTGNPVFPVAAGTLGHRGWTAAQAGMWDRGHAAPAALASPTGRLKALASESVLHDKWATNYMAIEQWTEPHEGQQDMPWWKRVGFLWLVLPVAVVLAAARGPVAWQLVGVGCLQLVFWAALTHLQSRFLLPALVPLALLVALGLESFATLRVIVGAAVTLQAALVPFVLLEDLRQVTRVVDESRADAVPAGATLPVQPPRMRFLTRAEQFANVDLVTTVPLAFRRPDFDLHRPGTDLEKRFPDDVGVYLVGEAQALFFHGRVYYHTVFDRDPLIELLVGPEFEAVVERRMTTRPGGVIDWLLARDIQVIVINWGYLAGPGAKYRQGSGAPEPRLLREAFRALESEGLRPVLEERGVTIYAVDPPARRVQIAP